MCCAAEAQMKEGQGEFKDLVVPGKTELYILNELESEG